MSIGMLRSLSGLSRTSLLQRKGRSALTGAGISLGVALFFGSLIANSSGIDAMDGASAEAAGNIDVVITPIGDIRQAVLQGEIDARAAELPDVRTAVGVAAFPTTLSTDDG